jgi:hypothetical protein
MKHMAIAAPQTAASVAPAMSPTMFTQAGRGSGKKKAHQRTSDIEAAVSPGGSTDSAISRPARIGAAGRRRWRCCLRGMGVPV